MNEISVAPRPLWIRSYAQLARDIPAAACRDQMWDALIRRHKLGAQQMRLQSGVRDYLACPPYPSRGRPPS